MVGLEVEKKTKKEFMDNLSLSVRPPELSVVSSIYL